MSKLGVGIVIVGPTASGKSALAVRLALEFGGEIISADSRQVYKGLNIGSGKVTKQGMAGVPHHLLDVASPKRTFTVAQYQKLGRQKLAQIIRRGQLPIICGGSGFYIESLTSNLTLPAVKPDLNLRRELARLSPAVLFTKLKRLDPARAKTIDRHNPRRLVRAIEIATALGKVPPLAQTPPAYQFIFLGLNPPLTELKRLIKKRLISRLKIGLVEEVVRLRKSGLNWQRLHDLGLEYREIGNFVHKNWRDFRDASEPFRVKREESAPVLAKLETEIFKYAKRQLTWLKRWEKEIVWVTDYREAKRAIAKSLRERGEA